MKKKEFVEYDTPQVEVVEASVECGYAMSGIDYPEIGEEEYL